MCSDNLESEVREMLFGLRQHGSDKESVRNVLLQRRLEIIRSLPDAVKKQEGRGIRLLRKPKYPDIKPVLKRVAKCDLALWKWCRVTLSSAPWTNRPGRAFYYFVLDENTGGILGIADIGSDMVSISPRDKWIGMHSPLLCKTGAFRRIANLGTCVCSQPFGWLCGGKFIAEAVSTKEISQDWYEKYGDSLATLTTTSLYGKSSQYNRLPNWVYLGTTPGGLPYSYLSSNDVRKLILFVKTKLGTARDCGYSNSFITRASAFRSAIQLLGINEKDLPKGQQRGVYVSELYKDSKNDLKTGAVSGAPERDIKSTIAWWLERWCAMRWEKVCDRIREFDFTSYRLHNSLAGAPSIESDVPGYQSGEGGAIPTGALHKDQTGEP